MSAKKKDSHPACLACGSREDDTPLISLTYRGSPYWICPRHMPVLIHNPAELIGRFPGADRLSPAEGDD